MSENHKHYAVDLFSGGGGLTVGLKKKGFFVVSSVEIDPHAYATYTANHPEVKSFKQDIRTIKGRSFLDASPSKRIDLLAGCPPCQGFTSLTNKYKRKDPRNELVREMGRLVEEIRPRAIMMENVPGMASRGNSLLKEFLRLLRRLGYIIEHDVLQVADYGVPQRRRRFVLVAGLGFPISIPEGKFSRTGEGEKQKWKTVRDALEGMDDPVVLGDTKDKGGPGAFDWHVVRKLSPENMLRIKHAKPGKVWKDIPENLRPNCHKGDYDGFTNVYGRMSWDEPSPTITGGCTTLSKGRFGHPEKDRTISVREASLLQTFPKEYIFDTQYMDHVCDIVGNALPCDFAAAIADKCRQSLLENPL